MILSKEEKVMWQKYRCPDCGNVVDIRDRFCGICGNNLARVHEQQSMYIPSPSRGNCYNSQYNSNSNINEPGGQNRAGKYDAAIKNGNGSMGSSNIKTPIRAEIIKLLSELLKS